MAVILNGNTLTLSGSVTGDDIFGEDCFCYASVVVALAQIDDDADLVVRINSAGGWASEGAAIEAILSQRAGRTDTVIDGIAASAGSLIAMAGQTVTMTEGSVMMIHDPSSFTFGNSAAHSQSINVLEAMATAYARVYARKSRKTLKACRDIMKAETWFTPEQAVEAGFADQSSQSKAIAVAAFDYRAYAHAPKRLKALASKKNWRLPDADDEAAMTANNQQKGSPMGDKPTPGAGATARQEATARIKAIMTADEAEGRTELAAHLAYETDMSPEDAIVMLGKAPTPAPVKRLFASNRKEGEPFNGAGLGGGPKKTSGTSGGLVAVMKQRHGIKE